MTTNLVVADASKTTKTICLAVTPSLKSYGISGRARLFEIVKKVQQINNERKRRLQYQMFTGSSVNAIELNRDPSLQLDYIVTPPQMNHYIEWSTKIYKIYLKYIAPEDIHVYSIDEVFIDLTNYLHLYQCTPRELVLKIVKDILDSTGITATAGIGTNLYLAKIAMDIGAKHIEADKNGVRIAMLDEYSYRKQLWNHQPITDFWRVGRGYAKKLASYGLYTMGDVAKCSLENEDLLYDLFGINAELLIDHAWGWEPCTIAQIKAYKPENSSINLGQVLSCPYDFTKTKVVLREMAENLSLTLFDKQLVTNQLVLTIGYDIDNHSYQGELVTDRYGRKIPKHSHSTINLENYTNSMRELTNASEILFEQIIQKSLLVRRLILVANHVISKEKIPVKETYEQLDLFTDYEALEKQKEEKIVALEKEQKLQEAMLSIKKKFGKNAILKGSNFREGATGRERNEKIGGHKA
ncbi:hypothetical protein P261_00078 [Lachnospiraceae bacterium TWA4]|nr:hypothetical protein P261_00078 [Lachnospiraceae bacterium TWA4]